MPEHLTSSPLDSSPQAVPPEGQQQVHSPCLCLLLSKAACSLLPPAGIRAQIGFSKVKLVRAGNGQEIWGIWISLASCPPPPAPHAPQAIMQRNLAQAEKLWLTEQSPSWDSAKPSPPSPALNAHSRAEGRGASIQCPILGGERRAKIFLPASCSLPFCHLALHCAACQATGSVARVLTLCRDSSADKSMW